MGARMTLDIKPPLRWWEIVLIVAGVWLAILAGLPLYLRACQWAGPYIQSWMAEWRIEL